MGEVVPVYQNTKVLNTIMDLAKIGCFWSLSNQNFFYVAIADMTLQGMKFGKKIDVSTGLVTLVLSLPLMITNETDDFLPQILVKMFFTGQYILVNRKGKLTCCCTTDIASWDKSWRPFHLEYWVLFLTQFDLPYGNFWTTRSLGL